MYSTANPTFWSAAFQTHVLRAGTNNAVRVRLFPWCTDDDSLSFRWHSKVLTTWRTDPAWAAGATDTRAGRQRDNYKLVRALHSKAQTHQGTLGWPLCFNSKCKSKTEIIPHQNKTFYDLAIRVKEHQKAHARASLIDIDTDYLNGTHVDTTLTPRPHR